ncbi:MAG TPA: hypothetical protein VNJ71_14545 [Gemmatimonadales bacterium]|jgi:hypothetical protein|nr:hypothetical protein [Gemmatimonadales bacterium]
MSEPPRDWDKELAEIDRMIARMPARSASEGTPAPRAPAPGPPPGGSKFGVFTTWLRVVLGLLLAVGITQWPYPNACGLNLAVYLGAIGGVVVAGLWSAVTSWQRRLGWAHTLSLLVVLWGLVLLAREVLPRTGYARTTAAWWCG